MRVKLERPFARHEDHVRRHPLDGVGFPGILEPGRQVQASQRQVVVEADVLVTRVLYAGREPAADVLAPALPRLDAGIRYQPPSLPKIHTLEAPLFCRRTSRSRRNPLSNARVPMRTCTCTCTGQQDRMYTIVSTLCVSFQFVPILFLIFSSLGAFPSRPGSRRAEAEGSGGAVVSGPAPGSERNER